MRRASAAGRPPVRAAAVCLAAAACVLVSAAPLRAQSDSLRAVLERVGDDRRVRLELRDTDRRPVGLLRPGAGDSLVLRSEVGARAIPLGRVSRLWTDEGTHAGRGALIGAVAGGGGGFIVGFIIFASDPDTSLETGVHPIEAGLILGGLAGGPALLGGALIGSLHTDWRLRYASAPGPGLVFEVTVR